MKFNTKAEEDEGGKEDSEAEDVREGGRKGGEEFCEN
jgi:hypothetical protein